MISFVNKIAKDLKELEHYQTLSVNEISAWIMRVLENEMNKACYATAEDYFEAMERNKKVKSLLKRLRKAMILSQAKVNMDSELPYSGEENIELIKEVEDVLRDLS